MPCVCVKPRYREWEEVTDGHFSVVDFLPSKKNQLSLYYILLMLLMLLRYKRITAAVKKRIFFFFKYPIHLITIPIFYIDFCQPISATLRSTFPRFLSVYSFSRQYPQHETIKYTYIYLICISKSLRLENKRAIYNLLYRDMR